MVFNPYVWSSVINLTVNISLISVLLICSIFYELSTENIKYEENRRPNESAGTAQEQTQAARLNTSAKQQTGAVASKSVSNQ